MNFSDAIPPNELLLAQLTASKLAKVMHGLMSVGTGSLGMEASKDFLVDRDKTPLGFLEVLRHIGVNAGHADARNLLSDRVEKLTDVTRKFYRDFMELVDWRNMPTQDVNSAVERLGDSYSEFCNLLGGFCSMLGMESDYTQQAIQDTSYLRAFFQTVSRPVEKASADDLAPAMSTAANEAGKS